MTPEQITALAKEAGLHEIPVQALMSHARGLLTFAALIEANTREACAKRIEQDLYPTEKTDYQGQYNAGVRYLAEQIRRME